MNHSEVANSNAESPQRRLNVRDVAVATLTIVAILAMALMAWRLAPLLLLIFAGVLAAVFRSLAEWTSRWTHFSYGWSLGIVVTILIALAAHGLFFGGQMIANQMAELAEQMPRSLAKLQADLAQYPWSQRLMEAVPHSPEEIPVQQTKAASYATSAVSSFSGMVAALLIVMFLAIYFAADPGEYVEGFVRLVPVAKRERVREVLGEVYHTLRWWLLGKVFEMVLVGTLTSIGLAALGDPLAAALGVIAAVLALVPNFGPVISAVPAVLLGFVQSPMTAAYVVLLYIAIQTVESYLITPLIQQRTVSLAPGLTIAVQVGMGILFGAGGVILATPIAAAALVAVRRLYVEDALEKPS